jgi:histidyl-tRNA synthetase
MAKEKPSIPKGTRDFGPQEVAKRKYILNTIEKVFIKYGFMPIETPTMENLSTLTGKYGDEGDKLLFNVLESGDFFKNTGNDIFKLTYYLTQFLKNLTYYLFEENRSYYKKLPPLEYNESTNKNDLLKYLSNEAIQLLCKGLLVESLDRDSDKAIAIIQNKIDLICEKIHPLFKNIYKNGKDNEHNLDHQFSIYFTLETNINELYKIVDEEYNSKTLKSEFATKGLRYDLTVPFARYVVMNRNEITFPFKRYQMQPVWRADRPQKGRYREFWQCDADVVGSDSLLHELDLINIYSEVFKCLGIEVEIKINNRKILAGIAEVVKGIEHLNTIAVAIDKLDKIGKDGVSKELTELNFTATEIENLFDIITIKGNDTEMLKTLKIKLQSSEEGLKGIEELSFIFKTIQQFNNSTILKTDFSLARGLSYYTGCIFEVAAVQGSLRSSIGGGGRYDNLTGIFGLDGVSGVGISFGLDRIYDVLEELKLFPETLSQGSSKVLICASNSIENIELTSVLQILNTLRNEGIASELYTEKINVKKPLEKPIKYASSKAIPYALIYTENEPLKLKNLETGFQEEVSVEEIVEKLKG